MAYRPPARSARARAVMLWDAGDTRGDAELAVELGVTTQTLRAYHQKWCRENGASKYDGRTLSDEIVAAIIEMRNHTPMTFPAIAEVVKEDYGYDVSAEHVRVCYKRGTRIARTVFNVQETDLPLATFGGIIWMVPEVIRGSCGDCRHRATCLNLALGSMLPCERPLSLEIMT